VLHGQKKRSVVVKRLFMWTKGEENQDWCDNKFDQKNPGFLWKKSAVKLLF